MGEFVWTFVTDCSVRTEALAMPTIPAPLAALAAVAGLAACAAPDPAVFDEGLRRATVACYARAIGDQWGATRPECSEDALLRDFGPRAAAATSPAEHLRALRDMLRRLDDPHAFLAPPDQPWMRVRVGDFEAPAEATVQHAGIVRADGRWWLRVPAAPGAGAIATWRPVAAIDGAPLRGRHDVDLALPGPFDSELVVALADGGETLRVPRRTITVRAANVAALGPAVDPERPVSGGRGASAAADATLPRFNAGKALRLPDGPSVDRSLFVWRQGAVGYVRIATFRVDADAPPSALQDAWQQAVEQLADCETLIVDLLGNGGGNWSAMACVVSPFLPDGATSVPHEKARNDVTRVGPFTALTVEQVSRIARFPLPPLRPARTLVLVDQGTASAAEITASILRRHRGARLIGEQTVGAETCVEQVDGPDGSRIGFGLRGGMTDGCERFQGKGLAPDERIERSTATLQARGAEAARDEQWAAIRRAALRAAGLDPGVLIAPAARDGA